MSILANVTAVLSPTLTREGYYRQLREIRTADTVPRKLPRLCTSCSTGSAVHGGWQCIGCQAISER